MENPKSKPALKLDFGKLMGLRRWVEERPPPTCHKRSTQVVQVLGRQCNAIFKSSRPKPRQLFLLVKQPKKIFGRCQNPVTAAKQWSRYSKLISKTRRAAQPAIELSVWRLIEQSEQDLRQAKQKEEEEEPPRGSAAPSSHQKIQHNKNSHRTRSCSRRLWIPRRSRRCQQRREGKRRQKKLDCHKRQDNFFRNSYIQKTNSFKQ